MKTIFAAAAALALLAALPAAATETIDYGVQPATQPVFIAKAAGLLAPIEKKYDVVFKLHSFSYGAPENQAMAAGAIQMASAGMGPAVLAAARLPAKLIAVTVLNQTAIVIPSKSTVKSMADLKGKTIAYPGQGSQQYPLLLKALADVGLKESDVRLFKTQASDVAGLIRNGSVDAGITWDPHVSMSLADGSAKVLLMADQILPLKDGHYLNVGVYARDDFLKTHAALVQDFVGALVAAEDLILTHPDQAIDMWAKEIGLSRDVIAHSLNDKISVFSRDIVPDEKAIATYGQFLKQGGILNADDEPKIDASFALKVKNAH